MGKLFDNGKGWHKESLRHREARLFGKASLGKNKNSKTISGNSGTSNSSSSMPRKNLVTMPRPKISSPQKNYRVDMLTPSIGTEKSSVISSELMTKKQAEALAIRQKKLGWRTAKAVKVKDRPGRPRGGTLYLVKFVGKDKGKRDFREVLAKNMKSARKKFLSQHKNVGIISISEKTPKAVLLEKKLEG